MPFRNRSAKRADLRQVVEIGEAISSTSSVDSSGLKKLADKAEKDITTVDVEQAVTLLEELKKVATPEQLVSLHKALLPTKEVETVINPANSQNEEQLPPRLLRQRSNLPPGLATRGGGSNDPLRKQLPIATKLDTATPRRKDTTDDSWISPMPSIDSITKPKSTKNDPFRALTPVDEPYLHAGAFGHGTLRITNGYASPDPSIYGDHFEVPHFEVPNNKSDEGYLTSSEDTASIDESRPRSRQDIFNAMVQTMSPITAQSPPPISDDAHRPVPVEEPTPVEPLRIRERSWPAPESIPEMAKRMQIQQPSELAPSGSPPKFLAFQERCRPADVSPLTSPDMAILSADNSTQQGNDDVSPVSDRPIPRYQQRWSQRMANISTLTMSRPDLSVRSPEGEDSPLLNFRSRLSTVNDEDRESDVEDGEVATPQPRSLPNPPSQNEQFYGHSITNSPQEEDENAPDAVLQSNYKKVMHELEVRTGCSTHDSGYASDDALVPSKHNHKAADSSETSTLADGSSVYNLQEFLQVQPKPHLPQTPMPAPQSATLNNNDNQNTSASTRNPQPSTSTEQSKPPSPAINDRSPLSPLSPTSQSRLNIKVQNKLTKPMPANIRAARLQIEIDTRVQKVKAEAASSPVPPVSPEASESLRMRVFSSPAVESPQTFQPALNSVNPTPEEMKRDSYFDNAQSAPERKGEAYFPGPAAIQAQRMRPRSKTATTPSGGPTPPIKMPLRTQKSGMMSHIRNISGGRVRWGSREFKKEESSNINIKNPDDELPSHVDLSSVARTLGSGSYDISTQQFKHANRGLPAQPPMLLRNDDRADAALGSPYAISTGLFIPKHKSMQGMNENAAMEFARMRSRDLAGMGMHPVDDERPRMAIPRRRAETTVLPPSTVKVEDRFPDWQGKPLSSGIANSNGPMGGRDMQSQLQQQQHQNSQHQHMTHNRPNSLYAESVPSMPDVPTDAEDMAVRADERLAERRLAAMSTGGGARGPRPPPHSSGQGLQQKPNRVGAMMLEERERPQSSPIPDPTYLATTKEGDRLRQWEEWRLSLGLSPADDEDDEGSNEIESEDIADQRVSDLDHAYESRLRADSHPRPPMFARTHTDPMAPSPAIVVSRYITPIGSANARPTDSAAQHADAYRDLIDDPPAESPINPKQQQYQDASTSLPQRADSANSFASSGPTTQPPHGWRPQTAQQHASILYKNSTSWQDAAPAGPYTTTFAAAAKAHANAHAHTAGPLRGYTDSSPWVPFSPNHAALAERSRACSLSAQGYRAPLPAAAAAAPTARSTTTRPSKGHVRRESAMPAYGAGYTACLSAGVFSTHSSTYSSASSKTNQTNASTNTSASIGSVGSVGSVGSQAPSLPSPAKLSDRNSPTRSYFDPRAAHARPPSRSGASTPAALMGSICGGGLGAGGKGGVPSRLLHEMLQNSTSTSTSSINSSGARGGTKPTFDRPHPHPHHPKPTSTTTVPARTSRDTRDTRASTPPTHPSAPSSTRSSSPSKKLHSSTPPQRPQYNRNGSSDSLFDRYSGGLSYGWNKETRGFGGSAGTRSKGNEVEDRKGVVPMGLAFGLDLSDVPVFLRRT